MGLAVPHTQEKKVKKIFVSMVAIAGALLVGCGADQTAPVEEAVALDSLESKLSYLIGYNQVAQLSSQGVDLQDAAYIEGVKHFVAGNDPAISPEDAEQVFADYQEKMQAAAQAEFDVAAEENTVKSVAFLEANKAKEGVQVTESGLQYKVLEAGEGDKPSADSTVQVHYEGRLINGEVFDSSIARGAPVEFGLNQVIPGWTEGLQLMSEGSKWELYIPSELAYGANGPGSIGPNQALIFEVELLQADFVAE